MPSLREIYKQNVGQTSEWSMMLAVDHAQDCYVYTVDGRQYIDLNSGISVSSLGHSNPAVIKAIQDQASKHLHTMVYGEHIQEPQVAFAKLLLSQLPEQYNSLYYLLTGSEAIEAAMKLCRKVTNRFEIVACRNAYHGSTQGAESLRSDHEYAMHFAPLVPGVKHINYNIDADLNRITSHTAGVIIEPVQAESGINPPQNDYLRKVEARCKEVGALFVLDEIQTGFGRTGQLFAHQKYGVTPDIFCIGKAMGGGLPLSGIVSSQQLLSAFIKNPALGHITTFGGHPLSCAAANASLNYLLNNEIIDHVSSKEAYIKSRLSGHNIVSEVRSSGLMLAVEVTRKKYLKHVVSKAIDLGVLVDYFLFNDKSFRVAPPLVIEDDVLAEGMDRLVAALDFAEARYQK